MIRRLLSGVTAASLVATGLALLPATDAGAWKPPSHLYGVEHALADAQDGVVSIEDLAGNVRQVAVNPTIRQALAEYPEYYRAGTVGPDAFPDTLFGQGQIHPDTRTDNDTHFPPRQDDAAQSHEWLTYLWEQAWNPARPAEERLQNIAFALGYMGGHANGDIWSHTWVNSYAGGVFPDIGDLGESDISVRHLIVEGYADKHRPGFEQAEAYEIEAPTGFVAETLILSDFARSHSASPVFDFFFGMQDGLSSTEQGVQHDNTTQDEICGDVFGATVCLPDPTDSPFNLIEWGLDLLIEEYLENWIEDIDTGLHGWVEVWETVAKELFAGAKPDGDAADAIMAALGEWVLTDLLSMLGLPDFVGDGIYLVGELVGFVVGLVTDALSAVFDLLKEIPLLGDAVEFVHTMLGEAKDFVVGKLTEIVDKVAGVFITAALGFTDLNDATRDAIDRDDDGMVRPSEVIRVLAEPEEYLEDPALFKPGTRAIVDADMHLPEGSDDDDESDGDPEEFRDYDIEKFAPLRDTMTTAKLAMLDETGLNALFTQVAGGDTAVLAPLYAAHTSSPGVTWPVPNNVMLGWAKSLDGEYQWRTTSPNDGHSYGTGTMPLFEDCISRDRLFRTHFLDPVDERPPAPEIDAFGDEGDAPTGLTDSTPPQSTLTLDGPHATRDGTTYVSGATALQVGSGDDYFADEHLRVFVRAFDAGTTPPAYGPGVPADPDPFTLAGEDGAKAVQYYAVDDSGRCNVEAQRTADLVLDNTPPVVTVTSPVAPGPGSYPSNALLPLTFTADDGTGAGVDPASARHYADGVQQPGPPGEIDLFDYPAGTHVYRAEQADTLGNLGAAEVPWTTVVTHDSLQDNLLKAFAVRGCITDLPTYHSLDVKLRNAEAADARGNDEASDRQLQAFVEEVRQRQGELTEPGRTISPYCANILIVNATALKAA